MGKPIVIEGVTFPQPFIYHQGDSIFDKQNDENVVKRYQKAVFEEVFFKTLLLTIVKNKLDRVIVDQMQRTSISEQKTVAKQNTSDPVFTDHLMALQISLTTHIERILTEVSKLQTPKKNNSLRQKAKILGGSSDNVEKENATFAKETFPRTLQLAKSHYEKLIKDILEYSQIDKNKLNEMLTEMVDLMNKFLLEESVQKLFDIEHQNCRTLKNSLEQQFNTVVGRIATAKSQKITVITEAEQVVAEKGASEPTSFLATVDVLQILSMNGEALKAIVENFSTLLVPKLAASTKDQESGYVKKTAQHGVSYLSQDELKTQISMMHKRNISDPTSIRAEVVSEQMLPTKKPPVPARPYPAVSAYNKELPPLPEMANNVNNFPSTEDLEQSVEEETMEVITEEPVINRDRSASEGSKRMGVRFALDRNLWRQGADDTSKEQVKKQVMFAFEPTVVKGPKP